MVELVHQHPLATPWFGDTCGMEHSPPLAYIQLVVEEDLLPYFEWRVGRWDWFLEKVLGWIVAEPAVVEPALAVVGLVAVALAAVELRLVVAIGDEAGHSFVGDDCIVMVVPWDNFRLCNIHDLC